MIGRGVFLILTVFAGVLANADQIAAADAPPSQLKAVWLSYLGRYVTWPPEAVPDAGDSFVVGVLGTNPYGKYIDSIKKRPIQGKPVVIRYFKSTDDYTPCHILLVSPLPDKETAQQRLRDAINVIKRGGNSSVLLVSDTPGLARVGSMVNYTIGQDGRVYLEVNNGEAQRNGLQISARLLNLSIIRLVKSQPGR